MYIFKLKAALTLYTNFVQLMCVYTVASNLCFMTNILTVLERFYVKTKCKAKSKVEAFDRCGINSFSLGNCHLFEIKFPYLILFLIFNFSIDSFCSVCYVVTKVRKLFRSMHATSSQSNFKYLNGWF